MALVVEDGTGLNPNANSYTDLVTIRAWALARGVTLPADDGALTILAIKAMDYIEAVRTRFKGFVTVPTQPLQWPRTAADTDRNYISPEFLLPNSTGIFYYDPGSLTYYYGPNTIPQELVNAQCVLTCEQASGQDLMPTIIGPFVKSEKIGVQGIQTDYDPSAIINSPIFPKVEAWLNPLISKAQSYGGGLRAQRV